MSLEEYERKRERGETADVSEIKARSNEDDSTTTIADKINPWKNL